MKKILFVLTWFVALLFGSCMSDQWESKEDDGIQPNENANTNALKIKVEWQDQGGSVTRTPVDHVGNENKISTLHLLFFEPKADRSGMFVDYVEVAELYQNPNKGEWTIDLVGSQVSVSDAYHILAVANIGAEGSVLYLNGDDVDAWMRQWNGKTENEVMTGALAWAKKGTAMGDNWLLMNSRVEKAVDEYEVSLRLSRNHARFDVHNELQKTHDLMSVAVYNAYPVSSIWNAGVMDFSENTTRIAEYYTIDNSSNTVTGGYLGNITGEKLYAFENQVPKPARNDRFTTALILGMRDRSTQEVTYYRTNITPQTGAHMIKRNNVYRLTIKNIGGPGADTIEEAYNEPNNNDLDYTINYWDIGEQYGVLASDGNSILSVPVKTIRISGKGTNTALSFPVFTFTNSANPTSPLEVRDQKWEPNDNGITVSLSGNTFSVQANALPGSTVERRGEVVFAYAGLKVSINIIQTDILEDNLQVYLPDGGIPDFAPFGGLSSGIIRVEASSPWTAELYEPGFSFSGNVYDNKLLSTELADNGFCVYTHDANPNETMREAFLLVSLDKDPENYAQVIRLTQKGKGQITIDPNQTSVTFDGMGELASVANNNTQTFTIRTTQDGENPVTYADWEYELGIYDARGEFKPDQTSAGNFSIVNARHDTTDPAGKGFGFTVETKGKNTSGQTLNTILRLKMKNTATFVDLRLIQQSADISLSPSIIPAVAKTGGISQPIQIKADNSLSWSATIRTNSGTAGTRTLVHHEAWLEDGNGNRINPGAVYAMSALDQFSVAFPKIYYPNREIPVSATVTVSIQGSQLEKEITVSQTTLTPDRFKAYGITGAPAYSDLIGASYHLAWNWAMQNINGYSTHTPSGNYYTQSIPASRPDAINYLHIVPHFSTANYNWKPYKDMLERDGWTVIMAQAYEGISTMNTTGSPMKQTGSEYQNMVYNADGGARIANIHSDTKVFQFLTTQGAYQKINASEVERFGGDGVSSYVPSPWPESAVVLTTRTNNSNAAMMIIDVKNRFFWSGESQQFDGGIFTTTSGPYAGSAFSYATGRAAFLRNLSYFLANAARYGSHFTDLFLEETSENPDAQKAPWDVHWGANAGVPSSSPGKP